jgi:FMN phosphatase YigB (HAD superfamily)
MKYKIISFDVWKTLLKSNSDFVKKRTVLFGDAINCSDYDLVKSVKDEVDVELDRLSEAVGIDFDFESRLNLINQKINNTSEDLDDKHVEKLRGELSLLFMDNLPILINPDTFEILKDLKNLGVKIALISNTGFLHGDVMRRGLKELGVLDLVDYTYFSNEVGCAKPHLYIYDQLVKESKCFPYEILHVGDSLIADYRGAWKSGISSLLFDPSDKYAKRFAGIKDIGELVSIVRSDERVLHYDNLSLCQLDFEEDKIVEIVKDNPKDENRDVVKNEFDLISYSKFKYGDGKVAKEYGHQLAKKFISANPEIFSTNDNIDLVITTSPYKSIVKGSSGIVKGFKNYINQYLFMMGKNSVVDITILKKEMFQGDYGSFSDEERKSLMNKNDLSIMEGFIKNKIIVLIDDARITGSHENNLVSFLKNKNIKEAYFLYVADMENNFATLHPDIESVMNHGWVDGLDKLLEIISSGDFILNARVCKFILSNKDESELACFLGRLNDLVLYDLYNGIVGDGYSGMPMYKSNFEILTRILEERGLLKEGNFNQY